MGDMAFVAGYVLATLVPALAAGRLVLHWRRGTLAVVAGLVAAWLGLFVRVALGPGFMAPMMD
jgi:hypothetical protein